MVSRLSICAHHGPLWKPWPCRHEVYCPNREETFKDDETAQYVPSGEMVAELRDTEAMLNAGKDLAAVL